MANEGGEYTPQGIELPNGVVVGAKNENRLLGIPFIEAHMGPISFSELQRRTDAALPFAEKSVRGVLAELMYEGRGLGNVLKFSNEEKKAEASAFALISAYYGVSSSVPEELTDAFDQFIPNNETTIAGRIDYFLRENLNASSKLLQNRFTPETKFPTARLKRKDLSPREMEAEPPNRYRSPQVDQLVYKGEQLTEQSGFWSRYENNLYDDQARRLVEDGKDMVLTGDHGIGKTQILTPAIYKEAQRREILTPKNQTVGENSPNTLSSMLARFKNDFNGSMEDFCRDIFGTTDTEKQKLVVIDESTILLDPLFVETHGTTKSEVADFLNALKSQNTQIIMIQPMQPRYDESMRKQAAEEVIALGKQFGIEFNHKEITAQPLPVNEVRDLLIALKADRSLIDYFTDPENDVLRHPRVFDALLDASFPDHSRKHAIKSTEDLKNMLTDVYDLGIGGFKKPGYEFLFAQKLGVPSEDLANSLRKIGIKISDAELDKLKKIEKAKSSIEYLNK
ncbi:MAG TPA: hypothetical protein VM077_00510 [Candidatus Limnocylindrales bacterium]|nr:hypothetical protein [Candidatus Limnocylindrales bacterium]